jgi:diguanylate cyclase (GGDEF)-like protein
MNRLSGRAQAYIIAVWIAAIGILVGYTFVQRIADLIMLTAMCALGAMAQVFRVRGATNRSSYELSWVIFGFALVAYGGLTASIIAIVGYIAEWLWRREPWYIYAFNSGALVIAFALADGAQLLISNGQPFTHILHIVGLFAGIVIFTLLNHLMVGIVLWLARGENLRVSGVFNRLTVFLDLALIGLGATGALLWSVNVLAAVLILPPIYVMYATLSIPKLERTARLDAKTGVYNANHFGESLETEWRRASNFNRPLTVVMADMDLLRNVNNLHGHLAGDAAIIGIARLLRKYARTHDVVARFGGEEFVLLMPETSISEALPTIEALRKEISITDISADTLTTPIRVTMSFGVACRSDEMVTSQDLLHAADLAVNEAKARGRNRVVTYPVVPVTAPADAAARLTTKHTLPQSVGGVGEPETKTAPAPAGSFAQERIESPP